MCTQACDGCQTVRTVTRFKDAGSDRAVCYNGTVSLSLPCSLNHCDQPWCDDAGHVDELLLTADSGNAAEGKGFF